MYIYTSLFTSIQAVCSHLFPSSAVVNIFLEIPAARSSIDVRWHHSGCSISSVHFKKTFSNAFSHLHINMNSTSTKQSPPNSQIWFTGHGPDHGQEGQPRRWNLPILQKACEWYSLNQSIADLHPPGLNGYKPTEDKQKCHLASHLHTFVWNVQEPLAWHSKRPHHVRASCWTLSKPPPCSHILHTCQQGYSPQWHLTQIIFPCLCPADLILWSYLWGVCWGGFIQTHKSSGKKISGPEVFNLLNIQDTTEESKERWGSCFYTMLFCTFVCLLYRCSVLWG